MHTKAIYVLKNVTFIFFVLFWLVVSQQYLGELVDEYNIPAGHYLAESGNDYYVFIQESPKIVSFASLTYRAFIEEIMFRGLPLFLVLLFDKSRKYWPIVAVISSILFGLTHGQIGNVFIQGVGGMTFCIFFVAMWKVKKNSLWALVATTFTHAWYNAFLLFT
ncbi:MAG TPA: CPBP family glutamic-type intramembrane protease [Candidatus Woesebacteria bacterium]|nr:CPBP family glutamic-type intramembrane protease [Candidatus Woesebacteria bacterium]